MERGRRRGRKAEDIDDDQNIPATRGGKSAPASPFEPAAVAESHTLVGLAEAIANLDMTGISDDRI